MQAGWPWAACLVLTGIKLWLTAGQTLSAIGGSLYDDIHFLYQAQYLLRGQWLGPYDLLTLIKGPFFPAWIAFTYAIGIPLLNSAQLLYAAACWVLAVAVKPLIRRNVFIPIVFGLVLFNPESNGSLVTRVIREMITPGLTLLAAACALGLLLRTEEPARRTWPWAAGLGLSFGALWLTREEEMVVLPFLLFICLAAAWFGWMKAKQGGLINQVGLWLGAAVVWAVIVYGVAATNLVRYGVFAKTEFDASSFVAAYGALTRVKPAEFKPFVPVTKETSRRIAKVSPAYAEIEPFIEGIPGAYWEATSELQQTDLNRHEILGGWFMWALRDAVNSAGYYGYGRYPDAFYRRLAEEVNAACQQRLLDCYGPRATLLPVWHNSYALQWVPSFANRLSEVASFRAVRIDPAPGTGTPDQLALFHELTRNGITPGDSSAAGTFGSSTQGRLLNAILRAYQILNPLLAACALVAWGFLMVSLLRRRTELILWAAITGMLILGLSRIGAIAYMNVSSLQVPPGFYTEDAYPAMLAFIGLTSSWAADKIEGLRRAWKPWAGGAGPGKRVRT